jgi:uncharacterized protein DUF6790
VISVFYPLVALVGAGVHLWRHPGDRGSERALGVVLGWWIVVTIGVSGIVGGLFHLLDGPGIANEIGFTRGDGGFQTEVGFGDVALGVAAVLCIWIRDRYWLAVLIVATISLWGDAYGHIHQAVVNGNHDVDNTGPILYTDLVFPLVAIVLYAARERVRGRVTRSAPEAGDGAVVGRGHLDASAR